MPAGGARARDGVGLDYPDSEIILSSGSPLSKSRLFALHPGLGFDSWAGSTHKIEPQQRGQKHEGMAMMLPLGPDQSRQACRAKKKINAPGRLRRAPRASEISW